MPKVKITGDVRREIVLDILKGKKMKEIAERHGLTPAAIRKDKKNYRIHWRGALRDIVRKECTDLAGWSNEISILLNRHDGPDYDFFDYIDSRYLYLYNPAVLVHNAINLKNDLEKPA